MKILDEIVFRWIKCIEKAKFKLAQKENHDQKCVSQQQENQNEKTKRR